MQAIEITNVTKTFGQLIAVNELTLSVPKGSIYGFIGPNGSGKTTTIRMIMNILYPDSGIIKIMDRINTGSRLDGVGYLPEERGIYKKMKVKEILMFHGQLKNGKNLNQEIHYWLDKFELTAWTNKKVESLSKGMSQKLQFIATIIDRPEIIILDEPFSGLDPVNAEIIKSSILELQSQGSTIIFSTHDMYMAERMCDYIFMIYMGKKVLDGTLESIQEKYGLDTLHIQTEKGASALEGIDGIEKINDYGKLQDVRIKQQADPQLILAKLLQKTKITKFEITKPSLHDIFIRIARPENKEEKQHA
jgi:ABC-2 type transport system ATP-binding protein